MPIPPQPQTQLVLFRKRMGFSRKYGCFVREVLLTLPSSQRKRDFTWICGLLLSRQTCAKQGTFLAEATRANCTLDLKQSWLGVLRPQQQLHEEAPNDLLF